MDEAQFQNEIDSLVGANAGLMLAVSVLIRTHPEHDRAQLELTRQLEQQLGSGAFSRTLSHAAQERMREVVEWLGAVR